MVNDAEVHAEEDQNTREAVEVRNSADSAAFAAEKLLKDNEDAVPEDMKKEVESKIEVVRSALKEDDVEAVKTAMQELQTSIQKVGEIVYSNTSSTTDDASGDGPSVDASDTESQQEGTVEGEYREV